MKYDAFISYRHAELDTFVAKKVHKKLETFKVPRNVAKKSGKRSIKRVFRDQEELPIGSNLNNNIETALMQSEYLIVICSPRTPGSEWVNKEISTFIQMHDRQHVLAVLVEGEPDEAFPELLLKDEYGNNVEPLAADVRGADIKAVSRKINEEIMRLAAPLLYCAYDDLRQRHRERKIRKIMAVASAVAALSIAFGVYSAYNAARINANYQEMLRNQSKYLAETSEKITDTGDRRTAALVAIEALPKDGNRPYVPEAEMALTEALNLYSTGSSLDKEYLLSHDADVDLTAMSDDGQIIVSSDKRGKVYVWDINTGKTIREFSLRYDADGGIIPNVGVEAWNDKILACYMDGAFCYDMNGEVLWSCEFDGATGITVNQDKTMMAVTCAQAIHLVDLENGQVTEEINALPEHYRYWGEIAFDSSSKWIAYTMRDIFDNEKLELQVYSLDDKSTVNHAIKGSNVGDICFDGKGNVYVSSYNLIAAETDFYLTGFSAEKELWCNKFKVFLGYYNWYTRLKYSSEINTLFLSDGQSFRMYDATTGEQKDKVDSSNLITDFGIMTDGSMIIFVQQDGGVYYIDTTTEIKAPGILVDADFAGKQLWIRYGNFAIVGEASSDILILKYSKDESGEEIVELDSTIKENFTSENNKYLCLATENAFNFYTISGEYIGKIDMDNSVYNVDNMFIGDDKFLFFDNGNPYYYDLNKREKCEFDFFSGEDAEQLGWSNFAYNHNNHRIFIRKNSKWLLADSESLEVINEGKLTDDFSGGSITDNGATVYGVVKEQFAKLDVKSGKVEIINENYKIDTYQLDNGMRLAPNEDKLALMCMDGVLRVINLENYELKVELPFTFFGKSFIEFSNDGNKLFMLGADDMYKVYDLETNSFIATHKVDNTEVYSLHQLKDGKNILSSTRFMFILDENYNPITRVPCGVTVSQENNKVLVTNSNMLYSFDYLSLDEIIEKAHAIFPGDELTEEQRLRYKIN